MAHVATPPTAAEVRAGAACARNAAGHRGVVCLGGSKMAPAPDWVLERLAALDEGPHDCPCGRRTLAPCVPDGAGGRWIRLPCGAPWRVPDSTKLVGAPCYRRHALGACAACGAAHALVGCNRTEPGRPCALRLVRGNCGPVVVRRHGVAVLGGVGGAAAGAADATADDARADGGCGRGDGGGALSPPARPADALGLRADGA